MPRLFSFSLLYKSVFRPHIWLHLKVATIHVQPVFSKHVQLVYRCCDEAKRAPCSWKRPSPPWSWGCSSCTCSTPVGWCMASCTPNLATDPRVKNASHPSWQGAPNYRYPHSFAGCFNLGEANNKYVDSCLWYLCPCLSSWVFTLLSSPMQRGDTPWFTKKTNLMSTASSRGSVYYDYTKLYCCTSGDILFVINRQLTRHLDSESW